MKDTNKLDDYIKQIEGKQRRKTRVRVAMLMILLVVGLITAGVWLYPRYANGGGEEELTYPEVPQDIPDRGYVDVEAPEDYEVEEVEVVVEAQRASLLIEGDFTTSEPLWFKLEDHDVSLKYSIDFGDGKQMDIRNMTRHLYRQPGTYKVTFTSPDADEPVQETIIINRRTGKREEDKFAKAVRLWEKEEQVKAFAGGDLAAKPSFPGGTTALMSYMQTHLGEVSGYEGRLLVGFRVGAEGKVGSLRVISGLDSQLDRRVVRALANMPDWIPAQKDGQNVAADYRLPFYFKKGT